MIQCERVTHHNGAYHRIAEAEVEDWSDLLDVIEGEPQLIGPVEQWSPYTHAFRLPDGSVYLVASGIED